MMKFTAFGNGMTIIGLGLEAGNIKRMQDGQPIRVKLSDLGFTGAMGSMEIVIFTGKDIASMRRDVAPFIGPETVIHEEG